MCCLILERFSMRSRKFWVRSGLVVLVLVACATGGFFLFAPKPIHCPSCGARHHTIFYSAEQRYLLELRAEQKMHDRILVHLERKKRGLQPGSAQWTPDDQEVVEYLHSRSIPVARFSMIKEWIAEYEQKVGPAGLRCPSCKQAVVQIGPTDNVYP